MVHNLAIFQMMFFVFLPSNKEFKEKKSDDVAKSQYDWYDGNTVATAIGQYQNNYTPATMAKYIATLATKGLRYQFHFLNKIESVNGELVSNLNLT